MSNDYLLTLFQYLFPLNFLSRLAGKIANIKTPCIKNYLILRFIKKYQVNMAEALEENPTNYTSFNDFFTRPLKPDARPQADSTIICPVDGFVSEIGTINIDQIIQAKGKFYSLNDFLGESNALTQSFQNGQFATLYLSPKDYHRVHMPITGRWVKSLYIPGELFSVQPATTQKIPRLFARNERLVVYFETEVGLMAMVLVGAVIVGTIGTVWQGDIQRQKTPLLLMPTQNTILNKGDELGYFKLGSTVVLLFTDKFTTKWDPMLKTGDVIRMGQGLV